TGDQLDRGDDEQAILDLFTKLSKEARDAGGGFYPLNGNHELMNADGDLRYVTAEGFVDFQDAPGLALDDPRLAGAPPQVRARLAAFLPGGPYAKVLARRPVILVVGDSVFVHGGVLPAHVAHGLERINADVSTWLSGQAKTRPALIAGDDSPVWTRAYSDAPDADDCATLGEALAAIPAKRMVVGHTVQAGGITSACDERVWLIDTGMAAYYGGSPQALEIKGDAVQILR
ncbi:MAG: metallophosphoesterase, partial [Myxococcales bacterium]|nr:metallophosphoesterase [Myxococcales bacterium]